MRGWTTPESVAKGQLGRHAQLPASPACNFLNDICWHSGDHWKIITLSAYLFLLFATAAAKDAFDEVRLPPPVAKGGPQAGRHPNGSLVRPRGYCAVLFGLLSACRLLTDIQCQMRCKVSALCDAPKASRGIPAMGSKHGSQACPDPCALCSGSGRASQADAA